MFAKLPILPWLTSCLSVFRMIQERQVYSRKSLMLMLLMDGACL
jgi:hypothetical protein